MYRRSLALVAALAAVLVLVPAALAARVHVRVEGRTQTIFGTTDPTLNVTATALDALEAASFAGEFYYHVSQTAFGPYVDYTDGVGWQPGFEKLVRGLGALDTLWGNDPRFTGFGPLSKNLFERLTSTGNRTGIALTASGGNEVRLSSLSQNAVTGVPWRAALSHLGAARRISFAAPALHARLRSAHGAPAHRSRGIRQPCRPRTTLRCVRVLFRAP